MRKTMLWMPLLAGGLALGSAAHAQDAGACPELPAGSQLSWEYKGSSGGDFCRALRADGSEAFGLYISAQPTFEPRRADREERGQVDGREVTWYRAELAADPTVQGRETVLQLPNGRSAHVWLQAPSLDQLNTGLNLVQGLHFRPGRGDQQVAGQ